VAHLICIAQSHSCISCQIIKLELGLLIIKISIATYRPNNWPILHNWLIIRIPVHRMAHYLISLSAATTLTAHQVYKNRLVDEDHGAHSPQQAWKGCSTTTPRSRSKKNTISSTSTTTNASTGSSSQSWKSKKGRSTA